MSIEVFQLRLEDTPSSLMDEARMSLLRDVLGTNQEGIVVVFVLIDRSSIGLGHSTQ